MRKNMLQSHVPSPYPVNLHAYLHVFCVRAIGDGDGTESFEQLTSDVVAGLVELSTTIDEPFVLWRGRRADPLQDGKQLSVLGVDYSAPESVHNALFGSLNGRYDDNSLQYRIDTGCTPFALFAAGTLYVFSHRADIEHEHALRLGTRTFPCHLLICVAGAQAALPTETHTGDDWSRFLERLRPRLTGGPLSNWPTFREMVGDLVVMRDHNLAINGFERLRSLCQDLGIQVIEAPTRDFGRTYLFPDWASILAQDFTSEPPLRMVVAIRQSLPEKQKAITLAHELAHYTHHLPMLEFFIHAYVQIQGNPSIETGLAKLLNPDALQRATIARELRADVFASLLMLPAWVESAARHFCELAVTIPTRSAQSPESLLLHFTEQYFGPDSNHLSWHHAVAHREDADILAARIRTLPYSPEASLRDRMLWCIYNRQQAMPSLVEEEARIDELVQTAATWLASFALSAQVPQINKGTLLVGRSTVEEIERQSEGEEPHKDTLIIEPAAGKARGYVALTPAWLYGQSNRQWTSPQLPQNPAESLLTWHRWASRHQRGIMLWPPDPTRFFSSLTATE